MVTACSDSSDAHQQPGDNTSKYAGVYSLGYETFTINADGTQTTVDATMFSEIQRGGRRVTPAKGVWRETAENEIVVTNLRFSTDTQGSEFEPAGFVNKVTFTVTFSDPVGGESPSFTVSNILIETFLYNQNPVTDEPVAVTELDGGAEGYRLEAGY